MRIGIVQFSGEGDAGLVFAALAERMQAAGLRLAGCVQVDLGRAGAEPGERDALILPGGPVLRLSQHRGALAHGARLNPAAMDRAAALGHEALEAGADALLVDAFGAHEAEARPLRALIAAAMARAVPALVGIGALDAAAALELAGPEAETLPADPSVLAAWLQQAVAAPAA